MKPASRQLGITVLVVALLGLLVIGAVWTNRLAIRDLAYQAQQPTLPTAIDITNAEKISESAPPTNATVAKAVGPGRPAPTTPTAPKPAAVTKPDTAATSPSVPTQQVTLPKSINLKVPMVYQAPLGIWDSVHEDACEEASFLMVKWFHDGRASVTRGEMEKGIQDLVAFENGISYGLSIDVNQSLVVLKDALGITTAHILPVTSIDDVKRQLASGRPVIIPASGKDLHNPNFKNGGPTYHMLVAKGYLADGRIITNDPGTRLGADYLYSADTLFNAIHDWNGGDVKNGKKEIIVVE